MTTLLVEKVGRFLEQSINLKNMTRYNIASIAPYIYMQNAPSGLIKFTITDSLDVVRYEKEFSSSEIKASLSTTDNNAHVFYPLLPTVGGVILLESGSYKLRLEPSTGYSETVDSFFGWCRQFDNLNNILDYIPNDDGKNPLAVRLKVLRRGIE